MGLLKRLYNGKLKHLKITGLPEQGWIRNNLKPKNVDGLLMKADKMVDIIRSARNKLGKDSKIKGISDAELTSTFEKIIHEKDVGKQIIGIEKFLAKLNDHQRTIHLIIQKESHEKGLDDRKKETIEVIKRVGEAIVVFRKELERFHKELKEYRDKILEADLVRYNKALEGFRVRLAEIDKEIKLLDINTNEIISEISKEATEVIESINKDLNLHLPTDSVQIIEDPIRFVLEESDKFLEGLSREELEAIDEEEYANDFSDKAVNRITEEMDENLEKERIRGREAGELDIDDRIKQAKARFQKLVEAQRLKLKEIGKNKVKSVKLTEEMGEIKEEMNNIKEEMQKLLKEKREAGEKIARKDEGFSDKLDDLLKEEHQKAPDQNETRVVKKAGATNMAKKLAESAGRKIKAEEDAEEKPKKHVTKKAKEKQAEETEEDGLQHGGPSFS